MKNDHSEALVTTELNWHSSASQARATRILLAHSLVVAIFEIRFNHLKALSSFTTPVDSVASLASDDVMKSLS